VTTAHALSLTFFHILANPSIKARLQNELRGAYSEADAVTWNTLSQLPFLSAVITEGLRLSFGVSHRLQRVSPDRPLQYKQYIIPPGTPVSSTQMFVMTDPTIFPQPMKFTPERWIPEQRPHGFPHPHEARKFFIPFSRGTRSCVGMNLAYAELFITIGTLMRPPAAGGTLRMELFETKARDFQVEFDWFNPCPPLDSKGLRVQIL
jgi:cytochrome P450